MALVALGIALLAGASFASFSRTGGQRIEAAGTTNTSPAADDGSGVIQIHDGDLTYIFEAVFGGASLFDTKADPQCRRTLARARPDDVRRIRTRLLEDTQSRTLEDLRAPHRATIEQLRALGYL
jgi:hypothetical protein